MLRRISKIVFYTLLLLCAAGPFLCVVSYFRQPCATFTGVFPDAANGRHHIAATAGICGGRISIEWTRIVDDRRPGSVSADVDPHFAWSPGLAAMPPVPLRRQLLGFEVDGDDRSYPAVMEGIDPAMQARITAQAYDYLRSRNLAPNEEAVKRVSSGTWTTTRHEHHASAQVPLILPCLALGMLSALLAIVRKKAKSGTAVANAARGEPGRLEREQKSGKPGLLPSTRRRVA